MWRRAVFWLVSSVADAVLLLIRGAAFLLAPFRLGRLLRSVSVPRLAEHRLRTSLTALGVSLGVAMLVAVVIVNDSLMRGITATVDDLAGKTDLQVSAGTSGFSEELLSRIREVPGVLKAVPAVQQTATVRDPKARGERLLVLGVDMLENDDASFRSYGSAELEQIRTDPLPFLNSPRALLLSRSFADRYHYKLHDTLPLATGTGIVPFEVWGFLDDAGVGRAFAGAVAVMYYQAAQVAFDRGQNVDRVDIAIDTPKGESVVSVEARVRAALGSGFIVEPPARKGDRIGQMLLGVRSALTIASLIAVLVGAFLIHNTMAISIVQRKREIGILRALGTRRGEVVALLTLEGGLLGVVGSALGCALGIGLSRLLLNATSTALNESYLQLAATQIHVSGGVLLAGFALGTISATLASMLPARAAAHNRPAETLRTSELMQHVPPSLRPSARDALAVVLMLASRPLLTLPPLGQFPLGAICASFGLLMAAALLVPRFIQLCERITGLVFRRLSVEARLGHDNLPRDMGRASTTAAALMAGVALAVSFGTFTHSFASTLEEWIGQTLPGDLFLTQGAAMGGTSLRNIPMADTLYDELRAIQGVVTVRRVRIVELPFRGFSPKAVSTDIDVFLRHAKLSLLEGEIGEVTHALQRGDVAVSENFARRFRVHRGDNLPLSTQNGTQNFRVAGVFIDYTSDFGSVLFDRKHYIATFHDTRVDTYELHLQNHADAEPIRRIINQRFGATHDLFVLTNREFRAEVSHTTDQIFSLVRALELVALVVAVLGIVNAQLANVLDRVREIGVLRALGMLRRQTSRMVVIEAVLLGAFGTLAGILLGSALGHVLLNHINLVQTGWYFPYRLSFGAITEVLCITIPAAALAGLYPARAAAHLVVTEALDYE
jgi:putative ABC transport system permease protein